MSERSVVNSGGRYARVSPIPGRGSKIAYSPCPLNDDTELAGNCLAIPMSSINTNSATNTSNVNKINKKGGCCSRQS
uniref:Uncharacterized protein n=1 Tax=Glossina brevipalpis TaxID=37001 RepID=A0A1A9WV42_9MUSC